MRILIADDDVATRQPLEEMVTKLGHTCLVAEDGQATRQLLAHGGIDVLLMDWTMAGLNGRELCRQLRDERGDRYIYIVLTTGLDHPEHILEGMGAGADNYLIEPVDLFSVQTRLVAAERVTALHGTLALTQAELERANLELMRQSRTDELTGLGNRRRMEEDLTRTHARATRVGRTYGIALFDIDYFKLYNDHYGHVGGDQTLRRVAGTIDEAVRAGECAYRYGGEEFLLLMPDCRPTDSILITGERIRQAVVEASIPHMARPSDPPLVTLSGGVSCWTPGSPLSPLEVLEEADEALFQAKSDGRNRVYAASSVDGCSDTEGAGPVGVILG